MNAYDYLKFTLELLNLMCDVIQDLEFQAENPENIKRLHATYENLRKAYIYASPIIERGKYL